MFIASDFVEEIKSEESGLLDLQHAFGARASKKSKFRYEFLANFPFGILINSKPDTNHDKF